MMSTLTDAEVTVATLADSGTGLRKQKHKAELLAELKANENPGWCAAQPSVWCAHAMQWVRWC